MPEGKTVIKKITDVVSDLNTIIGFVLMLATYFGYKAACQPEQLKAVPTYEIVFDVSSSMDGDIEGASKLESVKNALLDNLFYTVIGEKDNVALRFFGGTCPRADKKDASKLDGLAEDFGPKKEKVEGKIAEVEATQLQGSPTLTGAVIDAISHLNAAVADFTPEQLAKFKRRIIVITASDDACSSTSFEEAIKQKLAETGGTIKREDIENFLQSIEELRVVGVALDEQQKENLTNTLRSIDRVPVFADNAFQLTQLLGSQESVNEFQKSMAIFAEAKKLDAEGNYVAAESKYEQAAAGGIPQAHRIIGTIFYGHKKYEEALKHFMKAADDGDTESKTFVAKMMLTGQGGAEQNKAKAIALLQEACRAGDEKATKKLGDLGLKCEN